VIISIIVAVAENNVIGKDNKLIWHLPDDMKFFMEKTTGHCVITGRKNYESIPMKFRPLPNRTNIVVTNQNNYAAPGAVVVSSIDEGIAKAKEANEKELFIIGGAEIYKQTLNISDRIYLTKIYHTFDGDAFFPTLDTNEWKEVARKEGLVNEKNIYQHDYLIYEKIKK
jgi:dihydrofolate reductase